MMFAFVEPWIDYRDFSRDAAHSIGPDSEAVFLIVEGALLILLVPVASFLSWNGNTGTAAKCPCRPLPDPVGPVVLVVDEAAYFEPLNVILPS